MNFLPPVLLALRPFLAKELMSIGVKSAEEGSGGVHFEAYPEKAILAVFHSRCASRIYKKLFSFEIKTEKDLYFETKEIKWKSVFGLEQTFKIQTLQGKSPKGTKRSKFKSPLYLGQLAKDGIVDRFRKDTGERPSVNKELADAPLLLRVAPNDNPHSQKESVTFLLDMSGEPVSNRSYRSHVVEAPLRENLAAGICLKSGLNENDDFYNPMCGSGTILIEGMMVKGNIPPGYLRVKRHLSGSDKEWAFLNQNFYTKDRYLKENVSKFFLDVVDEAKVGIEKLKKTKSKNIGCDIDPRAIESARKNLAMLGLDKSCEIKQADATKLSIDGFKGKVIANPPYGERLQMEDLEGLYREFGETLKNQFKGSEAYVLTANFEMIKKIQLQTSERMILFNGNLESRLVKYELF